MHDPMAQFAANPTSTRCKPASLYTWRYYKFIIVASPTPTCQISKSYIYNDIAKIIAIVMHPHKRAEPADHIARVQIIIS